MKYTKASNRALRAGLSGAGDGWWWWLWWGWWGWGVGGADKAGAEIKTPSSDGDGAAGAPLTKREETAD